MGVRKESHAPFDRDFGSGFGSGFGGVHQFSWNHAQTQLSYAAGLLHDHLDY
jgi:hypothetical protein